MPLESSSVARGHLVGGVVVLPELSGDLQYALHGLRLTDADPNAVEKSPNGSQTKFA